MPGFLSGCKGSEHRLGPKPTETSPQPLKYLGIVQKNDLISILFPNANFFHFKNNYLNRNLVFLSPFFHVHAFVPFDILNSETELKMFSYS